MLRQKAVKDSTYFACAQHQNCQSPDVNLIWVSEFAKFTFWRYFRSTVALNARIGYSVKPPAEFIVNASVVTIVICEEITQGYVKMCNVMFVHKYDMLSRWKAVG